MNFDLDCSSYYMLYEMPAPMVGITRSSSPSSQDFSQHKDYIISV